MSYNSNQNNDVATIIGSMIALYAVVEMSAGVLRYQISKEIDQYNINPTHIAQTKNNVFESPLEKCINCHKK